MDVDDYDQEDEDEDDLIENEQFLLETEQFVLQTEEYDNPNVNAVESAMKKCTVCEQEDRESWECPLVDRVNISPQLARRIEQVRVLNKDKIRAKDMQPRKAPEFESKSKHNQPPPPRKATMPSPRTSTIYTKQHEAYMQSDISTVDFDMNN